MTQPHNTCPTCGCALRAEHLGGLCPKCVAADIASSGIFVERSESAQTSASTLTGTSTEFEILSPLAEGGMGLVELARDDYLGREVAVKRLRPERESARGARSRFVAEAQIASQLEHPGIVPVYQAGVDARGRPFYVMRRVQGVSLAEVLRHLSQQDAEMLKQYPLGSLLNVFQRICDAVAYAHSRGVIHRDLKPENVMLGAFGEVLVVDWGLAKVLEDSTEAGASEEEEPGSAEESPAVVADVTRTMDRTVVGTPGYMAPELAAGRSRQADERSDIYALGAILYTVLTLRAPLGGEEDGEVLTRVRSGEIRPPTEFNPGAAGGSGEGMAHCPGRRIPAALSAVAMKALALDPEDRYQRVTELQEEITAWQNGFATQAEQANLWRQAALWFRRHRTFVTVTGFVVALISLAGWQLTRTIGELRRTAPAFYGLATQALEKRDIDGALRQITYALALVPNDAEFLNLKGNLLQTKLDLESARNAYAQAAKLQPQRADTILNLRLCDEFLSQRTNSSDWVVPELERLRTALIEQGRHAEALVVADRMRQHQGDLVGMWNARLAGIGLTNRIVKRPNGSLELDLSTNQISDLSVLVGVPLNDLKLNQTSVSNLAALRGMPLASLEVRATRVKDLESIRGLRLEKLFCGNTRIADLTPLAGSKLRELDVAFTKVADLAPLKGLPLESLGLQHTQVKDLAPLRGMALRSLSLWETEVSDLSPLRGMGLVALYLPFSRVSDLSALESMPLQVLDASDTQVSDLTPIRSAPLWNLGLGRTRVADLRPLANMGKLRELSLAYTPVNDFRPLSNLRLNRLSLQSTSISDLRPLAGMPLTSLQLDGCKRLKDLSPILECRDLAQLTIPTAATNISLLRQLPKLKRLGYQMEPGKRWESVSSVEEFWRAFDARAPKR